MASQPSSPDTAKKRRLDGLNQDAASPTTVRVLDAIVSTVLVDPSSKMNKRKSPFEPPNTDFLDGLNAFSTLDILEFAGVDCTRTYNVKMKLGVFPQVKRTPRRPIQSKAPSATV